MHFRCVDRMRTAFGCGHAQGGNIYLNDLRVSRTVRRGVKAEMRKNHKKSFINNHITRVYECSIRLWTLVCFAEMVPNRIANVLFLSDYLKAAISMPRHIAYCAAAQRE